MRGLEGVRALLRAEWTAMFEQEKGRWVGRAAAGPAPQKEDFGDIGPFSDAGSVTEVREVLEGSVGETLAVRLPMGANHAPVTVLLGPRSDGQEYGTEGCRLLERIAPDVALALRKGIDLDRLRSQAYFDALTGCYNRRGFDERLQVELKRGNRYGRPTALMLVDLDGFKRINDELGHQAGDHVLRRFAELLSGTFRNTDVISRYGGDEFAVIFPETSSADAVRLAERARSLLRDLCPDEVIERAVTASFGIAASPADASQADALVASADRALYAAKMGGRDRVVAAGAPSDTADR